jgi:hypothetical protein
MAELLTASPNSIYPDVEFTPTIQKLARLGLNKKLASAIITLPKEPKSSYVKIINDEGLLLMINDVLNNGDRAIALEVYRLYQMVITTTFNKLIETLFDIPNFGKSIHDKICWRLSNLRQTEPIPYSILRAIYDNVIYSLETSKQDSNVVIDSSKNVQIARDIEALNLTNYPLLLQYFTNFRHFNKSSSSESIVFSATFTPQAGLNYLKMRNTLSQRQVFFKIFPIGEGLDIDGTNFEYDTAGLETESSIYEQLGKLVEFGVTPNILCSVWSGIIDRFDTDFATNPKLPAEFRQACLMDVRQINTIYNAQNPDKLWTQTGVVMTLPGEAPLRAFKDTLTSAERKQIFFQMLYTLYVFEHIEMSHGDLHDGNIFIQNIAPTTLNFQIGGGNFRMTTTKLVKIYDFDHGTICKNTNIKLNVRDSFTVNGILNPIRADGEIFNNHYGETNIFNKNFDFLILFCYALLLGRSPQEVSDLYYFGGIDPEFNEFMRYCMPGFYGSNPESTEKIKDTYLRHFDEKISRKEASKIFDVQITREYDLRNLGVSDEVLNMTWGQYFQRINGRYGRAVKSFTPIKNNQLWIPDDIIIPKVNMLQSTYFREYSTGEPINVTRGTVYSIDNRVL